MPVYPYTIKTDQGDFPIELDRPPKDEADLRAMAQQKIADQMAGSRPTDLRAAAAGTGQQVGEALAPALEFAGKSALPFAGGVLGGAAGGAVGGPPGAVLGTMAGSAGGEAANQALGLTEPDLANVATAGAVPGAANVVGGLVNKTARAVGGKLRSGRAALQEHAFRVSETLPDAVRPGTPANLLYAQVAQHNPPVDLPGTLKAARDLIANEMMLTPANRSEGLLRIATDLEKKLLKPGPQNFAEVWPEMQRIGARVGETAKAGGPEYGGFKLLFRAMNEDLEAAAKSGNAALPAVQQLRTAIDSAKRGFAADELAEQITRAQGAPQQQTGLRSFNAKSVLRWIESPPAEQFRKSMPGPELDLIKAKLEQINRFPALLPPPGTITGSSRVLGTMAAGEAIGQSVGLPPAVGAFAGNLTAAAASRVVAKALMSEAGRRWLTYTGSNFNHQSLMLMSAALKAGAFDEPGPTLKRMLPSDAPSSLETLGQGAVKVGGGVMGLMQ